MASGTLIIATATSPTRWSRPCFCPLSEGKKKCEKVSRILNVSVLAGGCKHGAKYAFDFRGGGGGDVLAGLKSENRWNMAQWLLSYSMTSMAGI